MLANGLRVTLIRKLFTVYFSKSKWSVVYDICTIIIMKAILLAYKMIRTPNPKSFALSWREIQYNCQILPEGKSKQFEAVVSYFFLLRPESRETNK